MVKKLNWYDERFRGSYRFKRIKLTLEEANERIHGYFPNIDILEYYGANNKGLVYCKDCNNKFWTAYNLQGYMYGAKTQCENCKHIYITNEATRLLRNIGLKFESYYFKYSTEVRTRLVVNYSCPTCGYNDKADLDNIRRGQLTRCKNCNYILVGLKYAELLYNHNLNYLKHETICKQTYVYYECVMCGEISNVQSSNLISGIFNGCEKCSTLKYIGNCTNVANHTGYKFISGNLTKCKSIHLFCGKSINNSLRSGNRYIACKYCTAKITKGKPKEHNKHLVTEYEKILKYTLDLKNEIERENINLEQLKDNLNYDFILDIYKHIEGWYNNFQAIKEKYPNGDLGTVLENNPNYINVWNIVVPVFEELINL